MPARRVCRGCGLLGRRRGPCFGATADQWEDDTGAAQTTGIRSGRADLRRRTERCRHECSPDVRGYVPDTLSFAARPRKTPWLDGRTGSSCHGSSFGAWASANRRRASTPVGTPALSGPEIARRHAECRAIAMAEGGTAQYSPIDRAPSAAKGRPEDPGSPLRVTKEVHADARAARRLGIRRPAGPATAAEQAFRDPHAPRSPGRRSDTEQYQRLRPALRRRIGASGLAALSEHSYRTRPLSRRAPEPTPPITTSMLRPRCLAACPDSQQITPLPTPLESSRRSPRVCAPSWPCSWATPA